MNMREIIRLTCLLGIPLLLPETPAGDTRVIDFYLPDRFDEALEASRDQGRSLLIKGVAFGIDEEGATCATKGHW